MNRIPRNFKSITVTVLSGNCEGATMTITKDEMGYHGRDSEGKSWHVFPSHLRNENFYKIQKIEK